MLGASQITWVGGRTVLSAIAALSFFALVSSQVLPFRASANGPAAWDILPC